ncbi:MAG: family 10 glycosylhydrolase [Melioribacteraceae bacterium]|nr:family 10 glycosylhydrolase [Melioribacteraceae bacterium]
MKKLMSGLILVILFTNLVAQSNSPKYELRGAWIATVANIDWPSANTLTVNEQYLELTRMLNALDKAGINTVFFQIRTECDAFYQSDFEPWSYWLTGQQGKAPEPFYDPLELVINEAHSRGMEFHAWFNPYRAERKTGLYESASDHVVNTHPEWILRFDEYKMLDPGNPDARRHILNVMKDVLIRYDVDGIHFDDYFYPYTPKISDEDSLTFVNFSRGFDDIDAWRRDNINQLMREIYEVINTEKPHVKFGISPFGIVKNEYAGTNGFNSYDVLYCDPLTWLDEKTVDYVLPQLYWELDHELAPYKNLLPWWASVTEERHLYVGHYSSKMFAENYRGSYNEIGKQIMLNRSTPNVKGSVYFSAKSISQNWSGFADTLINNYYKNPALPPLMEWKDNIPPEKPLNLSIDLSGEYIIIDWDTPDISAFGEYPYYYIIYRFKEGEAIDLSANGNIVHKTIDGETIFVETRSALNRGSYLYIVTALDRLHNESEPAAKEFILK